MAIIVPRTWNYDTKTWNKVDIEGLLPSSYIENFYIETYTQKQDVELTYSDHIGRMIKGHNS